MFKTILARKTGILTKNVKKTVFLRLNYIEISVLYNHGTYYKNTQNIKKRKEHVTMQSR